MNKLLSLAVVATLATASGAVHARKYGDVAMVVASTPVYERFDAPRQQCWTQPVTTYETRPIERYAPDYGAPEYRYAPRSGIGAGTVLGAIVGGVIGHQFGGSSGGRDRATAAGALLGGLVGHDMERRSGDDYDTRSAREFGGYNRVPTTYEARRCRTVSGMQERIVGYDVLYAYHGREFVTRLPYEPGRTLRVNVDVYPPEAGNWQTNDDRPEAPVYRPHAPRPMTPVYIRGY